MGLFALLLFLFETRVSATTPSVRRLFGFMFSFTGRTIFILFVGLICFGLVDSCPTTPPLGPLCAWSYALGFVTVANAFFNCYILCELAYITGTGDPGPLCFFNTGLAREFLGLIKRDISTVEAASLAHVRC